MRFLFGLVILLVFLCVSAGSAMAQMTRVISRPVNQTFSEPVILSSPPFVYSSLTAGKSYQCSAILTDFSLTDTNSSAYVFAGTAQDPDDQPISLTSTGASYPPVVPYFAIAGSQDRARVSLIAEKSGLYKLSMEDLLSQNANEPYVLNCAETTLYGSYNRFFAGVVIVEIENASDTPIPIILDVVDSNGVTVVDNRMQTAAANTRSDVIFDNLPANNFGQIVVTHLAPIGALSGTVAEYDFNGDGTIVLKRERPLRTPR